MKVYEEIKEMLCDELEDVVRKHEITPTSMDIMDTAVDILKDLKTIEAMDREYGYSENGGYSQRYMPRYIYDEMGTSYARGRQRDTRGRYMSDGYSGDTKEELHRLMETAKDDREREAIKSALDRINR